MDAQVLARWQFGITTVYHFFFVPITIGLTWLVAVMQTKWLRSRNPEWLRLTKFFGTLFLINFAAGVVTGIVQEFQFGMNWSEYSRFVGDIFGAPLALEALIAFFLESTFVGLWIFGWDRLPKRLHLATIYLTAVGTTISAIFILAANCWMQNPVGAVYRNGRAELVNFTALITNPFFLATFPHQIGASFMVAGGLVAGAAGWHLAKASHAADAKPAEVNAEPKRAAVEPDAEAAAAAPSDAGAWRKATRMGAWVLLVASLVTFISGDLQGKVEAQYQPMKLAASEGLLNTTKNAPFSIVGIYTDHGTHKVFSADVPSVLSFLAKSDPSAEVKGIIDLKEQYKQDGYLTDKGTRNELQQGFASELANMPIEDVPNVNAVFYSFRLMILLGLLGLIAAIVILAKTRQDRLPRDTKGWRATMIALPLLTLFGNSFGWILAEMGRQPWIVNGVLPTWTAVSPGVSAGEVLTSMILFTLVYGVIAVVVVKLFVKEIRAGLPILPDSAPAAEDADEAPLSFAY